MRKPLLYVFLLLAFVVIPIQQTAAHPGRTDSSGGHNCRTNCESWGYEYGYHDHNGGSSSTTTSPSPSPSPSPAPAPAPAPRPAPAPQPTPTPVPEPKKAIETINGLLADKPSNILWVDLILKETARTSTPTEYKTINSVKVATSRITGATQAHKVENNQKFYYVSSVTDGDTIKVVVDGRIERVRLLGIDTPETKDPRKPVQCFGVEASNYTKSLVDKKYVRLEIDKSQGDRDRYDRLLRYVYLQDGTEVNAELVKQGYAVAYLRYPVAQTENYKELQSNAEESGLGLWGACR